MQRPLAPKQPDAVLYFPVVLQRRLRAVLPPAVGQAALHFDNLYLVYSGDFLGPASDFLLGAGGVGSVGLEEVEFLLEGLDAAK